MKKIIITLLLFFIIFNIYAKNRYSFLDEEFVNINKDSVFKDDKTAIISSMLISSALIFYFNKYNPKHDIDKNFLKQVYVDIHVKSDKLATVTDNLQLCNENDYSYSMNCIHELLCSRHHKNLVIKVNNKKIEDSIKYIKDSKVSFKLDLQSMKKVTLTFTYDVDINKSISVDFYRLDHTEPIYTRISIHSPKKLNINNLFSYEDEFTYFKKYDKASKTHIYNYRKKDFVPIERMIYSWK